MRKGLLYLIFRFLCYNIMEEEEKRLLLFSQEDGL